MEYLIGYLSGSEANLPTVIVSVVIFFVISVVLCKIFGEK